MEDDQCAVQFLLSSMSPLSKKKTLKRAAITLAFTPVMKKLQNTYNIQLRTERLFTEDQQYLSPLGEKIAAFMLLDDNSFSCPDKDKEGVRYRRDTLEVLHEKFMCEEMVECHYSTFRQNIPKNIRKPKPGDWGTSLCKTCLNPELKMEALLPSSVDTSGLTLDGIAGMTAAEQKALITRFKGDTFTTYKE